MDKKAIINALRNYAQATSNELVGTVSGPIDIINTGLGYVGLGSDEPVGGSAWMQRQGLTAPVPEGTAKTLGEITGLVLPMVGAAKATEIAAALRGMGENIAKPKGGGMGRGQRGAINLEKHQPLESGAIQNSQLQTLDSLNPTGSIVVKYDPVSRANAPLGRNIATYDKTSGGSPDDWITIYRGAPKTQKTIVPGDFITTDLRLAKDYAGSGHVIEKRVKKIDVLDAIDEPLGGEYIYRPGGK